jgi:hypothetical protein
LTGRSSIPETAMLKPRSCGVLDAPVKPGHDSGICGADDRISRNCLIMQRFLAHH